MSDSILDLKPISRVRRNHGLEHATLHVLGRKYPRIPMAGFSDPVGFTIIGNVTTEDVAEAAIEALKKLRNGEAQLATHKNCGTRISSSRALLPGWLPGWVPWARARNLRRNWAGCL